MSVHVELHPGMLDHSKARVLLVGRSRENTTKFLAFAVLMHRSNPLACVSQ